MAGRSALSKGTPRILMFIRNPLVPELIVTALTSSLDFWVTQLGFDIAYQRAEEGFAYLDLQGAQIMLEQYDPGAGQWLTAPLENPLGRGINLQIDVPAVAPVVQRLAAIGWPLFREVE